MKSPFACCAFPLALAMSSIVGCGDSPPPKTASDKPVASAASPASSRLPEKAPDSPTASAVRISDEIVHACGISPPDAFSEKRSLPIPVTTKG